MGNEWNKIFNVTEANFIDLALEIFQFQYRHNSIYRTYVDTLKFNPEKIKTPGDIPFLPIRFWPALCWMAVSGHTDRYPGQTS